MTTISINLSPLSQWRYQLGSPSIFLMPIISVNISAMPHCQVGDKQEWCNNIRLYFYQICHTCQRLRTDGRTVINIGRTQEVLLCSSVNDDIAHIAVQSQHNDRFSNCVL